MAFISPSRSPLLPDDVRRRYAALEFPPTDRHGLLPHLCRDSDRPPQSRRRHPVRSCLGKTVSDRLVTAGAGLERLREACAAADPIPVYALGGVTEQKRFAMSSPWEPKESLEFACFSGEGCSSSPGGQTLNISAQLSSLHGPVTSRKTTPCATPLDRNFPAWVWLLVIAAWILLLYGRSLQGLLRL